MQKPAKLLRKLRGEATQHQFAELISISRSRIASAERGQPIGLRFAKVLSRHSGRSISDFIED